MSVRPKIGMEQHRGRIDYLGAKKELTALLQTDLTPLIYSRFKLLYELTYNRVRELTGQDDPSPEQVETAFSAVLNGVEGWNGMTVEDEARFLKEHLPKVESSFKALSIASIFVLNSIRFRQEAEPAIRLDIKPFNDYVHALYTCVAKAFARFPYLFEKDHSPTTLRKYEIKAYNIISDCVPTAIRSLLPVQKIYEGISQDIEGKKTWADEGPITPPKQPEPKPEPEPDLPPSPSPEEMARKTAASLLNAELDVAEAKEKVQEMPPPPEEEQEEPEKEEEPEEPKEVVVEKEQEQEEQFEDIPPDPDYLPFESVKKSK